MVARFWCLCARLVAVWGVVEVAAKVRNLRSSSGLVALGGLYRDNMRILA